MGRRWADDHADDAQVVIQRGTAPHPGGVAHRPEALDFDELLDLMSRGCGGVCCGAGHRDGCVACRGEAAGRAAQRRDG